MEDMVRDLRTLSDAYTGPRLKRITKVVCLRVDPHTRTTRFVTLPVAMEDDALYSVEGFAAMMASQGEHVHPALYWAFTKAMGKALPTDMAPYVVSSNFRFATGVRLVAWCRDDLKATTRDVPGVQLSFGPELCSTVKRDVLFLLAFPKIPKAVAGPATEVPGTQFAVREGERTDHVYPLDAREVLCAPLVQGLLTFKWLTAEEATASPAGTFVVNLVSQSVAVAGKAQPGLAVNLDTRAGEHWLCSACGAACSRLCTGCNAAAYCNEACRDAVRGAHVCRKWTPPPPPPEAEHTTERIRVALSAGVKGARSGDTACFAVNIDVLAPHLAVCSCKRDTILRNMVGSDPDIFRWQRVARPLTHNGVQLYGIWVKYRASANAASLRGEFPYDPFLRELTQGALVVRCHLHVFLDKSVRNSVFKEYQAAHPPRCEACNAVRPAMQRCGRCKDCTYCSKECQVADWESHKPCCAKIV